MAQPLSYRTPTPQQQQQQRSWPKRKITTFKYSSPPRDFPPISRCFLLRSDFWISEFRSTISLLYVNVLYILYVYVCKCRWMSHRVFSFNKESNKESYGLSIQCMVTLVGNRRQNVPHERRERKKERKREYNVYTWIAIPIIIYTHIHTHTHKFKLTKKFHTSFLYTSSAAFDFRMMRERLKIRKTSNNNRQQANKQYANSTFWRATKGTCSYARKCCVFASPFSTTNIFSLSSALVPVV